MDNKRITLTAPKIRNSSNYHYGDLMMQLEIDSGHRYKRANHEKWTAVKQIYYKTAYPD